MPHYVYIMASRSKRLYVGVTNNLIRRVREHKNEVNRGFSRKYQTKSLVYYEIISERPQAERRERQVKGWMRWKKIDLIETLNPRWRDLSALWADSLQRFFGR